MSSIQKSYQMTRAFWIGMGLLLLKNSKELLLIPRATALGAILIGVACMFPMYLWCAGKVRGMPIFPFFTLTYLWTFCLPLMSDNPSIWEYSSSAHLYAALSTALFLFSGTFVWWQFVNTSSNSSKPFRALAHIGAENFFLAILGCAGLLNMYTLGGWGSISAGLLALIRGIILGLSLLGIFVLCYRAGAGLLTTFKARLLFVLLSIFILTSAATLILKTALTVFLLSVVAYVVGGRKLPVLPLTLGLLCLLPLHYGKHPMRQKYWDANNTYHVQPWQYPAWFQEWVSHSEEAFTHQRQRYDPPEEEHQSFTERSSVIHMLMMAQAKIPSTYPYVGGATYAILPQLVLPRFINPNKIRSHEGTHMLNVHVRRQTYQDTLRTTIAWGLLPEAYANFGLFGCAGVGMFFGALYGYITRLGIGAPIFSARSLFGVLVLSMALASTEWTAGVYFASLFQSSMPLLGLRFVFMKIYRHQKQQDLLNQEKLLLLAVLEQELQEELDRTEDSPKGSLNLQT